MAPGPHGRPTVYSMHYIVADIKDWRWEQASDQDKEDNARDSPLGAPRPRSSPPNCEVLSDNTRIAGSTNQIRPAALATRRLVSAWRAVRGLRGLFGELVQDDDAAVSGLVEALVVGHDVLVDEVKDASVQFGGVVW